MVPLNLLILVSEVEGRRVIMCNLLVGMNLHLDRLCGLLFVNVMLAVLAAVLGEGVCHE